ncbi:MAG: hypothetical protein ACRDGI_06740 [Candidatus Limnocylindrales bacterium]
MGGHSGRRLWDGRPDCHRDGAKAAIASSGILPPDAQLMQEEPHSQCDVLMYRSAIFGNIPDDPQGVLEVVLEPGLGGIVSIRYDFDSVGGC